MIGRFSKRDRTVVAGRTLRVRLGMVDEAQVAPRRREVTAFAEIRRLRMRQRFSLCTDGVMAGKTLLRRALETPVDMARCAIDAGMRTGEWKSGQKVIECRSQRGLRVARRREKRHGRRDSCRHQT